MASNNLSDCEIFTNIQIAKTIDKDKDNIYEEIALIYIKKEKKVKKHRPPSQSLFEPIWWDYT